MPVRTVISGLLGATRALRTATERLGEESAARWTHRSTVRLGGLSERLVSDLLPDLAAVESVLVPHLDPALARVLVADHQKLRALAERIATITEALARDHRAATDARVAHAALRALIETLTQLEVDQLSAGSQLEASLSETDQAVIDEAFEAASTRAREHIVLVTQRSPDATDAYVLRRRPDLDATYAINLSDLPPARRR